MIKTLTSYLQIFLQPLGKTVKNIRFIKGVQISNLDITVQFYNQNIIYIVHKQISSHFNILLKAVLESKSS